MNIGYARVSTDEQNPDLQYRALRAAGCELIFNDRMSGVRNDRKGLRKALHRCGDGDILVVWKLDRLGRSLLDLVQLVEDLNARGVGLKVLTGHGVNIDTTTPDGRMMFNILAALAEFERELIRERTKAGMAAARQRGVRLGRPYRMTDEDVEKAQRMLAGGMSRNRTAEALGVNIITLRRALERAPGPRRYGSSSRLGNVDSA